MSQTFTQENAILMFLQQGGKFCTLDGRKAGVANPRAVINNLRNKGYMIRTRRTSDKGSYWTITG